MLPPPRRVFFLLGALLPSVSATVAHVSPRTAALDRAAQHRRLEEAAPPTTPRIKKVHIVSLTHLDVGGYGPNPGRCEDDCMWAADVCNTYFDVYLPAAIATAAELKAARTPPDQPLPTTSCHTR